MFTNHADPESFCLVQGGGDVEHGAALVPAADAGFCGAGELLAGGALANQIDGGGGVAGSRREAGGSANDFDAVVDRQTGHDLAGTPGLVPRGRDAVDHQCIDVETACRELGTARFILVDGNAGDIVERVRDAGQALILDALLGDHGDRLRRFSQG